jgi:hypothetical protein
LHVLVGRVFVFVNFVVFVFVVFVFVVFVYKFAFPVHSFLPDETEIG